jgi:MFS family permease
VSAVAGVVGQIADYRRLLGIRDYRLLWAAQVVSTYGDRLTTVALAALAYGITGSEIGLGLVLTIAEAPRAIFGLLAGAIADRVSRKTLLVATDCVRAVLVLCLALWASVPLEVVYLLTLLLAIAAVFFNPARYAVLPDIVPRGDLLNANTLDESTQSALDPVAFLAGGALVAAIGVQMAFAIDSLTFVVSAGLIAMTTKRSAAMWRAERDEPRPIQRDVADGVRLLFGHPILRWNMVIMLFAGLVVGGDTVLVYMMAFTHWERGALGIGIFEAGLAVGFVLGALVCGTVVRAVGNGYAVVFGMLGTGACMMLIAVLPFWPAVVVNGISGVLNMLFFVPGITLTQDLSPRNARARVMATRHTLISVSVFLSYLLVTALAATVPPATLMGIMGLTLALATVPAPLVRALRAR